MELLRHLQVVLQSPAYGIQALKILDADLSTGNGEMMQHTMNLTCVSKTASPLVCPQSSCYFFRNSTYCRKSELCTLRP